MFGNVEVEFFKEELIFVIFIKDINRVAVIVFVDITGGKSAVVAAAIVIRGIIVTFLDNSTQSTTT